MAKLTVPIQMRWSDVDGYGHLNNAHALTLLEEARVSAFWGRGQDDHQHVPESARLEGGPQADTFTLIVRQEIQYLKPISYVRTPLPIRLWICAMGGASLDVAYEVPDGTGDLAIQAITTIVLVDAATGRPKRITDELRAGWSAWMDEPPAMRRK